MESKTSKKQGIGDLAVEFNELVGELRNTLKGGKIMSDRKLYPLQNKMPYLHREYWYYVNRHVENSPFLGCMPVMVVSLNESQRMSSVKPLDHLLIGKPLNSGGEYMAVPWAELLEEGE